MSDGRQVGTAVTRILQYFPRSECAVHVATLVKCAQSQYPICARLHVAAQLGRQVTLQDWKLTIVMFRFVSHSDDRDRFTRDRLLWCFARDFVGCHRVLRTFFRYHGKSQMYCVMLTLLFSVRASVKRWRSTWHRRSRATPCGCKRARLFSSDGIGCESCVGPRCCTARVHHFAHAFSNEGEDVPLRVQMLSRSPTGVSISRSHCFGRRIELIVRAKLRPSSTRIFLCDVQSRVLGRGAARETWRRVWA